MSQKFREESVNNAYHIIEPIVEEENPLNSTFTMSLEAQDTEVLEYSMNFNMRLAFVKQIAKGLNYTRIL